MPEKKKVLWLTKGINRGGAEVLMGELASQAPLQAFEIHIASVLHTLMDMREDFERQGVVVHDLGGRSSLDYRWIHNLSTLMRHGNYSIIHSHSPLPASMARLVRVTLRRPEVLISTEHNVRTNYALPTRYLNDLTSGMDDSRIAVSQASAESFQARGNRLEVVYHGRDARFLHEGAKSSADIRRELGLAEDAAVIVTIANLRPEKNLVLLIDAFEQVHARRKKARLVIIGGGEEYPRIVSRIDAAHLARFVHLTGPQPRAWEYLKIADVFALSSTTEGLPVAAMEASMLGVPTVATDVGGLRELVADGESGFLVPSGSAVSLADRLLSVLSNDALRQDLGSRALERSRSFSAEAAALRYRHLYESHLQDASSRSLAS